MAEASVLGLEYPRRDHKKGTTMAANVGEVAPDFTLPASNNESTSLAQYRGKKHVVLSFHIFNFTSG